MNSETDNDWKRDEHWKVINGGGRNIATTAEQWWDKAVDYFRWCDEHPIKTKRTLTSGKEAGKMVESQHTRPYSVKGMCLHCGISEKYIQDILQSSAKESVWVMVCEKILSIIYTQNLEGAIVDIYNPIMVAKVLNMDKGDTTEDKPVRVEVVNSTKNELANSENEVLQKLDFKKVDQLKDKL